VSGAAVDVGASLTLAAVRGVGSIGYARLVRQFGSAAAVLAAGEERLMAEAEASPALAQAIVEARPTAAEERLLEWAQQSGVRLLAMEDPAYPKRLTEIADPPPLLYLKGDGLARIGRAVAVVGSRWITPYGRQVTQDFCRSLVDAGVTVVSGLAVGVDGMAHRTTLGSGGNTVAVMGTGLDIPYPPENITLFREIAEKGAVVSEFPPGTRPVGHNFPRRNRIISGLSIGVLVVEAKKGSGSLITARMAAEQGRTVYAVPGNIDQPGSAGVHALIREGATLVTSPTDLIADLLPQLALAATGNNVAEDPAERWPGLPGEQRRLLAELDTVPMAVDTLAARVGRPVPGLLGDLLALELAGLVEKLPGNRYIRPPSVA